MAVQQRRKSKKADSKESDVALEVKIEVLVDNLNHAGVLRQVGDVIAVEAGTAKYIVQAGLGKKVGVHDPAGKKKVEEQAEDGPVDET